LERASNEYGNSCLAETEHLHEDWELVQQYPLSPSLLALSQVWRSRHRPEYVIAAKGAPEAVVDLCYLTPDRAEELMNRVDEMAADGLRVLGVARAFFPNGTLPPQQHDFDFEFVGLIGLNDLVRPGVAEAVQQCYSAGIRVLMITGDHPATAMNVASQIGLRNAEQCITGPELERMSDEELRNRVRDTTVFARMVPEQKLKLVRALKANNEIVAMTGDGVNDAPALRAANMGIAMGRRGTRCRARVPHSGGTGPSHNSCRLGRKGRLSPMERIFCLPRPRQKAGFPYRLPYWSPNTSGQLPKRQGLRYRRVTASACTTSGTRFQAGC